MKNEVRRRKPEPTLLLTQAIFFHPHRVGMVSEELAFDDVVKLYTAGKWIAVQLNVIAVTTIRSLNSRVTNPVL